MDADKEFKVTPGGSIGRDQLLLKMVKQNHLGLLFFCSHYVAHSGQATFHLIFNTTTSYSFAGLLVT
jgi:hypothetical protein